MRRGASLDTLGHVLTLTQKLTQPSLGRGKNVTQHSTLSLDQRHFSQVPLFSPFPAKTIAFGT